MQWQYKFSTCGIAVVDFKNLDLQNCGSRQPDCLQHPSYEYHPSNIQVMNSKQCKIGIIRCGKNALLVFIKILV